MGVVLFTTTGIAFAYSELQGNIDRVDVGDLVADEDGEDLGPIDPNAGRALNILLLGSDQRDGENGDIGGVEQGITEGMRSDTTLLLHISADRARAELVSIPRDLLVPIPACELPDGTQTAPAAEAMFNSAFTLGSQQSETGSVEAKTYAAACTIRTVQAMTGITIDDFALVDFAGFQSMIDAIGGVTMCIEEDLSDSYTGLALTAGEQVLDGTQALQYARARHIVGTDGSDIGRIGRQQLLLAAIVRGVLSKNVLTDTAPLYQFLSAATSSLTTSTGLGDLPTLAGLAMSLKNLPAESVTFTTVPFDPAGNRVRPNALSGELWAAVAADEPLAPEQPDPEEAADGPAAQPTDGEGSGVATGDGSTAEEPPEEGTAPPAASDVPWDVTTGEAGADACGG